MTTRGRYLSEQLANSSKVANLPLLGYALYWNIRSIEIPDSNLKALLKKHKLQESFMSEISARTALRKALKKAVKKRMIRLVFAGETETVYAVVHENIDKKAKDISYKKESLVVYNKKNEYIRFKGHEVPMLKKLFNHYSTHYTGWTIRKGLLNLVDKNGGVTLRQSGGVYYLDSDHKALLERLFQFVQDLSPDCYLHFFGIVDSKAAKKALLVALREELKTEITKQRRDLTHLAKRDRKMSDNVVAHKEEKFTSMRRKIDKLCATTRTERSAFREHIGAIESLRGEFRKVIGIRAGKSKKEVTKDPA